MLRLSGGQVDFHTALKVKVQIEAADRAVSAADQDGLGLYTAAGAKSAMRVLIPASPTTLLGLNDTTLTVGADGLSLQAPGSPTQLHAISGWRISDSIVVAAGQEGEVDLTGQDAGTLMRVAGRQAPLVDVHLAPLRTLLAPLLVFLQDATTLAGAVGADLHLRAC